MNLLKIIQIFNWIVVAFLVYLVAAESLFPAKGGDAAGRGMGQAIYYLAIIALAILVILNLLPFVWAKYTAFGLVAVPILLIQIGPVVRNWKRNIGYVIEDRKPIFPDKERDQIARAVRDGNPEKLKELLKSPVANLNQDGELLAFAINQTSGTAYRPDEKLACVRLLLEAGAKLDSAAEDDVPIYMSVASTGNPKLLRLMFENGADANAVQKYFKRPILFESIGCYQEPEASVRVLLEFGADPNSRAILDDETGPVSPLWQAAVLERWGVCVALLEKGADPDFKTAQGKAFRDFVRESERDFPAEGYSTKGDYARLLQALK